MHVPAKGWELNSCVQSPMPVYFLHDYVVFFYSAIADEARRPQTCKSLYRSSHFPSRAASISVEPQLLQRNVCLQGQGVDERRGEIIHSKSNTTKYRKKGFNFHCTKQRQISHIFCTYNLQVICWKKFPHVLLVLLLIGRWEGNTTRLVLENLFLLLASLWLLRTCFLSLQSLCPLLPPPVPGSDSPLLLTSWNYWRFIFKHQSSQTGIVLSEVWVMFENSE